MDLIQKSAHQQDGFSFMNWEVTPSLRNKNNQISFLLHKKHNPNDLKRVIIQRESNSFSVYSINDIVDVRDSGIKDRPYIVANTTWSNESAETINQ